MTVPSKERDSLPWVQYAQWVLMAPISSGAKVVYGLLVAHVLGHEKGNRTAWPTQRRLANLLGYKRIETIDHSVRELETYGLVEVERGRHPTQPLRKRNTYKVRLVADPALANYTGRLSVWERPDLDDDDVSPGQPGTRVEPGSGLPEPTAGPTPGPSEPGSTRVGVPGCERVGEPGQTRVEVERSEEERVDEERSSPPPAVRAGAVNPTQIQMEIKPDPPMHYCGTAGCARGYVLDGAGGIAYCVQPTIEREGVA